jgi:methionine sulfoxide reductase heme-binding subunit
MATDSTGALRKIADNIYVFWAILAAPAVYIFLQYFVLHGRFAYVPRTGEFSAWLLIITMSITPLMLLLGPLPWLKARRRYFGVASFGYATLHLLFWLKGANWGGLIKSVEEIRTSSGWVAMAIMGFLFITSNDWSVRTLGPKWKTLQRWIYPVAILTLIHWLMTTKDLTAVAVYTLPLIALTIWRVMRRQLRANGV